MYLCEGELVFQCSDGISKLTVTVFYPEPEDTTLDDKMQDMMSLASRISIPYYSLRELTLVSQTRFKKGDELCQIQEPVYSLPKREMKTSQSSPIFMHIQI